MISTCRCLDGVATPEGVLANHIRMDPRVAVFGEVAIAGTPDEAAVSRGVEPAGGLRVWDNGLRRTA
jgi:hypothetical protein